MHCCGTLSGALAYYPESLTWAALYHRCLGQCKKKQNRDTMTGFLYGSIAGSLFSDLTQHQIMMLSQQRNGYFILHLDCCEVQW